MTVYLILKKSMNLILKYISNKIIKVKVKMNKKTNNVEKDRQAKQIYPERSQLTGQI